MGRAQAVEEPLQAGPVFGAGFFFLVMGIPVRGHVRPCAQNFRHHPRSHRFSLSLPAEVLDRKSLVSLNNYDTGDMPMKKDGWKKRQKNHE